MSRSDFEARLKRLTKTPSVGAKRAVHKAMLQDRIGDLRRTRHEDEDQDQGEDGWSSLLPIVLMLSFLVLGGLFVHDPDDAVRKAVVMVPLMLIVLAAIIFREVRRSRYDYLQFNFWIDLELIAKLLRMLR